MLKIIRYPHHILAQKCEPFDFSKSPSSELHAALNEMANLMDFAHGMGLAANQVGLPYRFFIMKDLKGKLWEFINPEIEDRDGSQFEQEGCLSAPGVTLQVPRAASVSVRARDRNGEEFRIVAEGMEAVCIQHEIDHLDGVFFTERVSRQQRRAALRQIEKAGGR